jgi:hypothetical protein
MRGARRLLTEGVVSALLVVLWGCQPEPVPFYDFALIGDAPYRPDGVNRVEALIRDVNRRGGIEWAIHVGDTKAGGQACTDELLRSRFELYQGFAVPFVFTPGDNDWFDCPGAEDGVDEYERLAFLRSLYFPDPGRTTGGRAMTVQSQSEDPEYREFVENALWVHGGVVYATLHLVVLTREPTDPATARRRQDAAVSWVRRVFEVARESGSVGVFLATQADPWIASGRPGLIAQLCEVCTRPRPGLESLYSVLAEEATAFDGQVVMAVGDTHVFRVDKPLYEADGSVVENFTRVETFGEPDIHWVRVRVDPTERSVFSFHQEIVSSRGLLGGWPGVPGRGRRTDGSEADTSASAR